MEIGAQIEMLVTGFQLDTVAIEEMLRGPYGPVAQDLARRAIRTESQAKLNASGRPGPNVRTGRLRGSIAWRLGSDEQGAFADIGTQVVYAHYVEMLYPYLLPALSAAQG